MSKIAIRPYFEKTPNMGLEKYNKVVFDGVTHKQDMWAKEDVSGSGRFRYITGLNEFAPEITSLPDEEREAKIKQIRTTVVFLEGVLASNKLDIKDKSFWNNVKVVSPENHSFWATIRIAPSNEAIYLDPNEPEDLIKITSIEAGGFPDVAPSFESAKKASRKPKFFLDRTNVTIQNTTKVSISESRAKSILIELYDNNINKLRYLCKALDANSTQYKKSTPNEVLFGNMSEFIEGKLGSAKTEAPGVFLKRAALDMETLKLQALVKDASFYRILTVRSGQIYEGHFDTSLGYNVVEVVEFLKNPLNDAVLQRLLKQIESYWNE